MPQFETSVFIKPPDSRGNVIVFGKSPDIAASDSENGVARFGGTWRAPSYVLSYMKSAAILVDHGVREGTLDDIALPAFYMQRHALELFLKRLLSWIYDVADFRLRIGHDNRGVPTATQTDRYKRGHNLDSLLKDLRNTSTHFGFGEPPSEIAYLVRQVSSFEMTDTWSRYERSERKDKTVVHHVKKEVVLPIVDIQMDLETLYSNVAHKLEGEPTYECGLYEEWLRAARSAGAAG
jgi:hypothetical protein